MLENLLAFLLVNTSLAIRCLTDPQIINKMYMGFAVHFFSGCLSVELLLGFATEHSGSFTPLYPAFLLPSALPFEKFHL